MKGSDRPMDDLLYRSSGVRPVRLAIRLPIFETLGEDAQRQRLRFANSFVSRLSVRHDARQLGNFRDPAAVGFLLDFDCIHGDMLSNDGVPR